MVNIQDERNIAPSQLFSLEGKKVKLVEFTEENLYDPKYYGWLRDLEVVNTLYRLEYLMPLRFQDVKDYVHNLIESKDNCYFTIRLRETNEFIGTVRLGHINWHSGVADVGIMVGEKGHWGQGYAKDSINTLIQYAFQTLSLRRLGAGTPGCNVAMRKCFESLGFTQEGIHRECLLMNGEFSDHITFGLLKKEFIAP